MAAQEYMFCTVWLSCRSEHQQHVTSLRVPCQIYTDDCQLYDCFTSSQCIAPFLVSLNLNTLHQRSSLSTPCVSVATCSLLHEASRCPSYPSQCGSLCTIKLDVVLQRRVGRTLFAARMWSMTSALMCSEALSATRVYMLTWDALPHVETIWSLSLTLSCFY